jgi:hypothetical protein
MNAFSITGSLLLLAAAAGPAGKGSASGTFHFRDKTHTVAHAVAWSAEPMTLSDGSVLRFVTAALSAKPFDRAAMARDGSYGDDDMRNHPAPVFTVVFNARDGAFDGVRMFDDTGHGADFRCEGPGLLTLSRNDKASVAGKFKCQEHDLTFDAPILETPRKATP